MKVRLHTFEILFGLAALILIIIIFLLLKAELKYHTTLIELSCSPPAFIKDDDTGLSDSYKNICNNHYSAHENLLFRTPARLKDYRIAHWSALNDLLYKSSKIKKEHLEKYLTDTEGQFKKPISESLWLAVIEIKNRCDKKTMKNINKCIDLIEKMKNTDDSRLYYKKRLVNLNNNFSDDSDFMKRLGKHIGGDVSRLTCAEYKDEAAYYFKRDVEDDKKINPCQHSAKTNVIFHEGNGYYSVLIKAGAKQ